MFFKAFLIVICSIICLVGVVLSLIYTVLQFSSNKPYKFYWLGGFFISVVGFVFCVMLFAQKSVNKIKTVTQTIGNQFQQSFKNLSDSMAYNNDELLQTNQHLQKLQALSNKEATIPNMFYTYLGFESYYRFPLTFPYSLHCTPFKDNGELYNEKSVLRFDKNDNGEIDLNITHISKIAFDANFLLMEQSIVNEQSNKAFKHYVLFLFATEEKIEFKNMAELLKQSKIKGYKGSTQLQTIEEYSLLFN